MRILFLLHSYPKIGGIEMVTQTISRYLGRRHELFYLARIADGSLPRDEARCFYFPPKNEHRDAAFFDDLVRQLGIDAVINQGPFLPFTRLLDRPERDHRVRVFTFLHFTPGFDFERIKYAWKAEHRPVRRAFRHLKTVLGLNSLQWNPEKTRRLYRRLYALSEKTVVLAPEYVAMFRREYGLAESDRLTSIPNPSRYACDDPHILERKRPAVLFVGRLEPEKRVDRLLAIWNRVKEKDGWRLRIVGDGSHREALEQLVARDGIEGVEFAGQCADVAPHYAEASVVALTSATEGFGLCFAEGIQFGAVPLSFDVSPGNRELFGAISPELLIPPFSEQTYAERLQQLLGDKNLRRTLAEKALRKAADYSLDAIGRQWDHLLE